MVVDEFRQGGNKLFSQAGALFAWFLILFFGFCQPKSAAEFIESSDRNNEHKAYPRPSMQRSQWISLDGQWECGTSFWTQTNVVHVPERVQVPFPYESELSGTKKLMITEKERLWYRRNFRVPEAWRDGRVLLHFEAVDWETHVSINGHEIGSHRGAFERFTFDITAALKESDHQEIVVSVWDPSDSSYQPRGKQALRPRLPFLRASSGIWQSVWIEGVPNTYVAGLRLRPDVDNQALHLSVAIEGETENYECWATVRAADQTIRSVGIPMNKEVSISIPNPYLWSPESPFLYDLNISLIHDGISIDEVSSYFGMRKVAVEKGREGFPKIFLNNEFVFQLGPLDQGCWPDGIYTASSDDALRYDIETMKSLGFNMVRKHVKVEPERWYYWCDKLGLLVWQDMPNGDRPASAQNREINRRSDSARQFEHELLKMISGRGNHPSIIVWVAFNQGWGQYDTARITDLIKKEDPSRLVISASGWYDEGSGDIRSIHRYFGRLSTEHDGERACVIGECGAFGFVVPGHSWDNVGQWNTSYAATPADLLRRYESLLDEIKKLKDNRGLSGAVITQLSDVEGELNGYMTFDRKVIKYPVERLRKLHNELIYGDLDAQ